VKREQWDRLKTLFTGALEQPADERQAWLRQQAGGDEMLLREAAALLQAHETADGFLDTPATIDLADFAVVEERGGASAPMKSNARSAAAGWGSCTAPGTCGSGAASR